MTTLQISDELAEQIAQGTHVTGETCDIFLREAVLSRLEDIHDVAIAKEYLHNPDSTISLDELKKNLGLDD